MKMSWNILCAVAQYAWSDNRLIPMNTNNPMFMCQGQRTGTAIKGELLSYKSSYLQTKIF